MSTSGLSEEMRFSDGRSVARGRRRRHEVVVVRDVIHGDVGMVERERTRRLGDGRDGGVGDAMG
jgi:hypothetical protein